MYYSFGRIVGLSNSNILSLRNIKSITEFKLFLLSEYLVGIELVEYESENQKHLQYLQTNHYELNEMDMKDLNYYL